MWWLNVFFMWDGMVECSFVWDVMVECSFMWDGIVECSFMWVRKIERSVIWFGKVDSNQRYFCKPLVTVEGEVGIICYAIPSQCTYLQTHSDN